MFAGLLTVREECTACGLDLKAQDAGDGPAIFVILLVGALAVGLAFIVESIYAPPTYVHLIYQTPLVLGLSVFCLRPLKATMIALQYRHQVAGFGNDH